MQSLVRFGLLLLVLLICVAIVAAHGVRGAVFVIALMALLTVPQTRFWRASERFLVRLTGSRRRAAVAVFAVIIGSLLVFNIYQLVH